MYPEILRKRRSIDHTPLQVLDIFCLGGKSPASMENLPWQNADGPNEYARVSSCENAKEVLDKLKVIHEGTNDVKETKISLLNLENENFRMNPNEGIKSIFDRFSIIVNQLK
ncbi:hypothetical protein V6N13_059371 [Hibiscus sabdariffa]